MASLATDSELVNKTSRAGSPATDAVTAPTVQVAPSFPQRNNIFARVKEEELQRAQSVADEGGYQPGTKTDLAQLELALVEFDRRLKEEDNGEDDDKEDRILWVLVATDCDAIPNGKKIRDLLEKTGLIESSYSGVKFVIEDRCLFIVAFTGGVPHGAAVVKLLCAMNAFNETVGDAFYVVSNVALRVTGGTRAPDAVLNKAYPVEPGNRTTLRTPFIAEVHSKGKTMRGSLVLLSEYLEVAHSDYVMYLRMYDKDQMGLFSAVVVLWRAGQGNAPLGAGAMAATLVDAQSFGTKPLPMDAITALGRQYGHLPGVPADDLALRDPQDIVIPRAELLHNVVDATGTPVVGGVGDLTVNLVELKQMVERCWT